MCQSANQPVIGANEKLRIFNWAIHNPDKFAAACKAVPIGNSLYPALWEAYMNDKSWHAYTPLGVA